MKRRDLERHLRAHGCVFLEHGARHDAWVNPSTSAKAPMPRHDEIKYPVVRSICRGLGVPIPPGR